MYLGELLTEDEFDVLEAKLRSARAMHRAVAGTLYSLLDDMNSDYPYTELYADVQRFGSVSYFMATKMSDGMYKVANAADRHDKAKDELSELLSQACY